MISKQIILETVTICDFSAAPTRQAQSAPRQPPGGRNQAARLQTPVATRHAPRVIKRQGAVLSRLVLKCQTVTLACIRVNPPIAVPTIGRPYTPRHTGDGAEPGGRGAIFPRLWPCWSGRRPCRRRPQGVPRRPNRRCFGASGMRLPEVFQSSHAFGECDLKGCFQTPHLLST